MCATIEDSQQSQMKSKYPIFFSNVYEGIIFASRLCDSCLSSVRTIASSAPSEREIERSKYTHFVLSVSHSAYLIFVIKTTIQINFVFALADFKV